MLTVNNYTPERFDKFNLYTGNIRDYGRLLMQFKQVDTKYKFENLLTYGTYAVNLVSLFFIFELLLISL